MTHMRHGVVPRRLFAAVALLAALLSAAAWLAAGVPATNSPHQTGHVSSHVSLPTPATPAASTPATPMTTPAPAAPIPATPTHTHALVMAHSMAHPSVPLLPLALLGIASAFIAALAAMAALGAGTPSSAQPSSPVARLLTRLLSRPSARTRSGEGADDGGHHWLAALDQKAEQRALMLRRAVVDYEVTRLLEQRYQLDQRLAELAHPAGGSRLGQGQEHVPPASRRSATASTQPRLWQHRIVRPRTLATRWSSSRLTPVLDLLLAPVLALPQRPLPRRMLRALATLARIVSSYASLAYAAIQLATRRTAQAGARFEQALRRWLVGTPSATFTSTPPPADTPRTAMSPAPAETTLPAAPGLRSTPAPWSTLTHHAPTTQMQMRRPHVTPRPAQTPVPPPPATYPTPARFASGDDEITQQLSRPRQPE